MNFAMFVENNGMDKENVKNVIKFMEPLEDYKIYLKIYFDINIDIFIFL
jgi:hypothetical protein